MILVGDIGGTKTRLAIFSSGEGLLKEPRLQAVYPSAKYDSLESMVREFMSGTVQALKGAVFGVAGPVIGGKAILTNLPWVLEVEHLREGLGLPSVMLVNDVLAMAAAIHHLGKESILTLQAGQTAPHGNVAVIAPGTGLGEAFLTHTGTPWQAHATEGGHTDFAPRNEEEFALWKHLLAGKKRVSCERVCSGPGIEWIYQYLREVGQGEIVPKDLTSPDGTVDFVPRIVEAAMNQVDPCPLCVKTLRLYASILGAEAGNLALKVMATGGVYLGGGIPPRIVPFLQEGGFLQSFNEKGRMSKLMACIPVHVILDPRAPLLGAACLYWEREGT